jgi:hypothetical protein
MINFSKYFASVAYRSSKYFLEFLIKKHPKLKENLMVNSNKIFFSAKLGLPNINLIIMRRVTDPLEKEDNVYSIVKKIDITNWSFTDHVRIVFSMIRNIFNSFREKDGITIKKLKDARRIITYIALIFRRTHNETDSGFFNVVDEFIFMCDLLTMDGKNLQDLNAIDQDKRIIKLFEIFLENENAHKKFTGLAKRLFSQFYAWFFPDQCANTIALLIITDTSSPEWMKKIAAWFLSKKRAEDINYLCTI